MKNISFPGNLFKKNILFFFNIKKENKMICLREDYRIENTTHVYLWRVPI